MLMSSDFWWSIINLLLCFIVVEMCVHVKHRFHLCISWIIQCTCSLFKKRFITGEIIP